MRIVDGNVNLHNGETKIVASTVIADQRTTIGIGTTNANGAIDFADAGRELGNGSSCFMIVPRNTNVQRTGLITATGAIIFNTDVNRFQGYTGVGWTDFHGV